MGELDGDDAERSIGCCIQHSTAILEFSVLSSDEVSLEGSGVALVFCRIGANHEFPKWSDFGEKHRI